MYVVQYIIYTHTSFSAAWYVIYYYTYMHCTVYITRVDNTYRNVLTKFYVRIFLFNILKYNINKIYYDVRNKSYSLKFNIN